MNNKTSPNLSAVGLAALLTLAAGMAQAASPYTWTPLTAGPFNWDNAGSQDNWGQGTANFPNAIGDVASMAVNLSANQTNNLNQAITVGSLTIGDNSGAQTATLAANGGSLTFDVSSGNASLIRTATGTGATTISANIALNDDLDISLASGAASSTMTLSGIISGSGKNISKDSSTLTLVLSGANTFTGTTTLNGGTLILNNATALGGNNPGVNGSSGISMAAGTTLRSDYIIVDAGNIDSYVYAPITLSGTGNANFLIGAGSSTAPAEAVTFNLNGAIGGADGTDVVFGNTTASRNNANSIIVLGAASTYNGNTTIQAGNTANRINVIAGVANALPATTVLSFDAIAGAGTGRLSQYDLNGNDQTLAGLDNGGVVPSLRNQRVTSSAAAATLTISNSADCTYGGANGSQNAQITGAIALTKNGTGKFTLAAGAGNSFTGNTKILGGILSLGHATSIQNSVLDTAGSVLGDANNGLQTTVTTLTMGGLSGNKNLADVFTTTSGGYTGGLTNLTLNTGASATPSYSGIIADGATGMTLTKAGTGTQTLSGASTFTGNLLVSAGTLKLDTANDRLSTSAGLEIAAGSAATATLDLSGYDQTLSRLVFTAANAAGNLTVTGGVSSTLTINTITDTELGAGGAISAARDVTIDMSGLGEFVWNGSANVFRVGVRNGSSNSGGPGTFTTTLADTNTITAARIAVGDIGASNNGGASLLHLGSDNTLNADIINVGASGRSHATLDFRSGLTAPAVTIRGSDGSSRVTSWDVGRVAHFGNSTWTATVDFAAAELDALVTNLRIGIADTGSQINRAGTENATFSMGKGTLDVNTLIIGQYTAVSASSILTGGTLAGNGTFNLDDAAGTVTVESIILADNIGTATNNGTVNVSGTFNLNAGTLEAKSIGFGNQTGNATTVTPALNFTSGTMRNYSGFDLAIANVPINLTNSGARVFEATAGQSITIASSSVISGSGQGFTKSGDGTMTIDSVSTYSGPTILSNGTLIVNGSLSSDGTVTVVGGTLGGTGSVGTVTVKTGGTLAPGNSAGLITLNGALDAETGSFLQFELASATSYDQIVGITDLTLAGTIKVDLIGPFSPSLNDTFNLMDWSDVTPVTTGLTFDLPALTGLAWDTTQFDVDGSISVVIPEPATLGLIGMAGLALALRRRRG